MTTTTTTNTTAKTTTTAAAKLGTGLSALMLLAVATLMPACDLETREPCDPNVEICPFTGNNPGTLDPGRGNHD